MSRAARVLIAIVVALALAGADGCKESPAPPSEPKGGGGQQRLVLVTADSDGPYTVEIRINGEPQGKPEPVAGGQYSKPFWYASGRKLRFSVLAYGAHKDVIHCTVSDGDDVERQAARGAVRCALTTKR